MTPYGWMSDTIALAGIGWAFGGLLFCGALGALVGWWRGSVVGLGTALCTWGVGHVVSVVLMALFVQVDSLVLTLGTTRCEPDADHRGRPLQTRFHAVQRAGEPAHEVQSLSVRGVCGEDSPPAEALRVRKDALASPLPVIPGEPADSDTPLAVMVILGAFGSFALLGGGLLLAHGLGWRSGPESPRPDVPPAPWRKSLGMLLSQLGLLLFLAAFVVPWFLDGSPERALQVGMRGVATAMVCWLLAGLIAGTMNWGAAIFLLFFGGAMLGFAELARRGG